MRVLSGRYEVGERLGSGGMATVMEGRDQLLDRRVAVKLMRDAADPVARKRFLGEARTAAQLHHPNAVTVYDTGEDGDTPWIAMELVEGRSLAERLADDGPLDPDEATAIARSVLDALAAAHAKGLIHRDVKPANILLPYDGGVKLADFGIAKAVQEGSLGLTRTGQVMGTATYLAPEQIEGEPATPASDVYALGIVLYEALTGTPPFVAETSVAVALAHLNREAEPIAALRPDVPEWLADVVDRALRKDPAERYADAAEMRTALAGAGTPIAAPTAPSAVAAPTVVSSPPPAGGSRAVTAERATRDGSRGPGRLAAVGFGALMLLVILALFAVAGRDGVPAANPTSTGAGAGATVPPGGAESPPAQAGAAQPSPPADQPPPAVAPPTDLATLLAVLTSSPEGELGPRQDDLARGIEDVVTENAPGRQAQAATDLQRDIAEWVEAGEVDPATGQLAIELLDPFASQGQRNGNDDDGGDDEGDDDSG